MVTPDATMKGRVALVTGASRGIGRATALALAARGASVAVNYQAAGDEAAAVVTAIENLGAAAVAIPADVSEPAQATELVERARQELGGLHVLVNNAGISRDSLIFDMDLDEAWRVMKVNLGGVVNCTRAAVGHFMAQHGGSIVNVSSVMADGGWTGASSYAASKGAINSFTLCSAVELARFGIRVNAVLPGFTATDLVEPLLGDGRARQLARQIPARAFADAEQIGQVIAFVAGPGASYMTGALVRVDGGFGTQLGAGRAGG
jgi:3-oxoacyl-[acyl-carrier protein] reductase